MKEMEDTNYYTIPPDDNFEQESSQIMFDDVKVYEMVDKDHHIIEENIWSNGAITTDDELPFNSTSFRVELIFLKAQTMHFVYCIKLGIDDADLENCMHKQKCKI
jgi:hypothetical protein